ncbi:MAG: tetratricopeptide repeat protein [Candidatus Acidiferrum sp.]
MRRRAGISRQKIGWLVQAVLLVGTPGVWATGKQNDPLEAGRRAYEKSDYAKAVEELQAAAAREPENGEIELLLTKSFLELEKRDAAIASAERAVEIDPQSSVYHEWLGKAYGEKASHASMFTAFSLARKTHREFETAVQLDPRNYSARQALIEYYCSAPGIVGGGEDRAKPVIAQLESMDASEWHYAKGNCRRQKNDFAEADAEFQLALESHPKSANLIYDIGDYAVKRSQADRLLKVAEEGERAAPGDPRGLFYRAVGLILKNEKPEEAERLLGEYVEKAPKRTGYPRYAAAHDWLGHLYESRGEKERAEKEYEAALQLNAKDKSAKDALKRLRSN